MRAVPPAVDDPGGAALWNSVPDVSEVDDVPPLHNVHLKVRAKKRRNKVLLEKKYNSTEVQNFVISSAKKYGQQWKQWFAVRRDTLRSFVKVMWASAGLGRGENITDVVSGVR